MNKYTIKFYGEGNIVLHEFRHTLESGDLRISDFFFTQIQDQYDFEVPPISFDMYLHGSYNVITVKNLTLFSQFNIKGDVNENTEINYLICEGINVHATNLRIHRFNIDDGRLLLANSTVDDIVFDSYYFYNRQSEVKIERQNQNYKLEIRNTCVTNIKTFFSLDYLILQNCTITKIEFLSLPEYEVTINNFISNLNTKIEILNLSCTIESLLFEDTNINRLNFSKITHINSLKIVRSYFERIYGCEPNMFSKLGIAEYELLKTSSINEEDSQKYCDYSYNLESLKYKRKRTFGKWFLKSTTGFSYKPFRAIHFSLAVILIFASLYSLCDLHHYLNDGNDLIYECDNIFYSLKCFFDRVFFSGITYTTLGYNSIPPMTPIIKALSVIESGLGMIIFALIVHSITTRYLKHK